MDKSFEQRSSLILIFRDISMDFSALNYYPHTLIQLAFRAYFWIIFINSFKLPTSLAFEITGYYKQLNSSKDYSN